ncbi:MAG: hypothetical protein RLZZ158_286 [Cyanobacteriota bacterium]|jgi:TM2 domain
MRGPRSYAAEPLAAQGSASSNGGSSSAPVSRSPSGSLRHVVVAYLFWGLGLVGICGLQRLYNRKPLSGLLYLFSFGFFGVGQIIDLFLIPAMVERANYPMLLEEARRQALPAPQPLGHQLLVLARQVGAAGFTINDAVLAVQPSGLASPEQVRAEIQTLMHAELLDVTNDARGRVVYREP